jgi:hypothetical protein
MLFFVLLQGKIMARVKEEVSTLRHANKELQEQVKRLQEDRFDMVEALVYQRWIHTCLGLKLKIMKTKQETPQNVIPERIQAKSLMRKPNL